MTKQIISAAMCLTLCISLSGCAAVGKDDRFIKKDDSFSAFKWPWQDKEEEPYPSPVKMAVTWTPDILVQPGRTPTRGFGGRVYFYNEKSQAVPVEGDLMVHGFDETAMAEGNQDRTKRYRFTADQFKTKFSKTDLGASYSIWIPWDASGGHESQLSLVPSFKTSEGKVIQGEAARLLLPGKKRENIARAKRASAIRQVGHYVGDMAQHDGLSGSMGLQTTTIPLPASFQQRLSHMREQPRITNANRIAMPVIQRPPAQTQVLPTPTAAAE